MKHKTNEWSVNVVVAALVSLAACVGKSDKEQMASARAHLDANDAKSAIVELKSVLQQDAGSAEARYLLGVALLNVGDPVGALVELDKANNAKYDNDKVVPQLARALLSTGHYKKITDDFAGDVHINPKAAAELKVVVANAHVAQSQFSEAAKAAEAALKLDPANFNARMLYSRVLAGRGSFDEALALVDKLVKEQPARAEPHHLKGELLWAGMADLDAAGLAMREALKADSKFLPAHLSLIRLALARRDVDSVKAQVSNLKKALPSAPETLMFETQLALLNHDVRAAKEGSQQLVRLAPENSLVRQLAGAVEFESGNARVAEDHLTKALQLSPELLEARFMLAQIHMRSGQPAKALTTLQPLFSSDSPPPPAALAIAAEAHMQSGNMAKAESLFSMAAKAKSADPKVRTSLALLQMAKGEVEPAFAQLESAAASDSSTYANMALISARLQRGDLDGALKAVDALQQKLPNRAVTHSLRGRILAARRDLVGARASFEKALELEPGNFPAVVDLAGMDAAQGKFESAIERYQSALMRDPKNYLAMLAKAKLRQQAGANADEVQSLLVEAVRSSPGEAAPRLVLVEHLLAAKRSKEATVIAQEAVAALPNDLRLLDALGSAQLASGDTQQAIASFRKIAAAQPGLEMPHLRLADAYLSTKDFASARQSLVHAIEIDPNSLAAQRGLILVAMADKRWDEAAKIGRMMQKANPNQPAGYFVEGEIRAAQRSWESSIAAFRAALDRSRTTPLAVRLHATFVAAGRNAEADRFVQQWMNEHPKDADFLFQLGLLALQAKEFAKAESLLQKVLKLQPENAAACNNLAWLTLQLGKPGALAMAERANQLLPGQPAILDTLAAAHAEQKNVAMAVDLQRKAVGLAPNDAALRLNLAKLLIVAGDRIAARVELERVATLGAKFSGAAEAAALLKTL